ncbi:carboxylate-amine ligase [Amycolatopsis palatopharyngis]|uniref:carboxylate-amine ligase n=1 Tax=Amycolatopsis palatopharyngis TaxID=187982 RepID=UPI000E27DCE4|nr:glutamate--cysteine ligase [Amycolatopsis palatopharyngis]
MTAGHTLGVEEEFLLLDPGSGHTVGLAPKVLAQSPVGLPEGVALHAELRDTQVEAATGICAGEQDLRAHLLAARTWLAERARSADAFLVASGTPPFSAPSIVDDRSERFARIDSVYAGMVADYEACGCHIHVGVTDPELAVAVVNRLRPWLPTLLALSVNSPLHDGRDTGFGSWRMVQQSRFPGSGVPPWFADRAGYDAEVARLVDCGVLVDERMSFWLARPSPTLPTIEFRVADTATTIDEAVLFALLTRALVRTTVLDVERGAPAARPGEQIAAAAVWSAARYGLDGDGVDMWRARRIPAAGLLRDLVDRLRPALEEAGDLPSVLRLLSLVRARGTGAQRQRRAARDGTHAVIRMLARETHTTPRPGVGEPATGYSADDDGGDR